MKVSEFTCPFAQRRADDGIGYMDDQNDPVSMLLKLKDVRKAAHNWQSFQSAAVPGRIVIPSEVDIRTTRQIPFELDPPQHTSFRALVEPWFKRPLEEEYQVRLYEIISNVIDTALSKPNSFDVVSEFALPLQSRALTLLLNEPFEESEVWIAWGTHVFRSEGEALDADKANILYEYIDIQIEKALQTPSNNLYSVLLESQVDGKKLSKEEVKGILILTFAGGRDTVINAVTNTIAYFADYPDDLARLKTEPNLVNTAVEELLRYFSPLTQMGRVVTKEADIAGKTHMENTRISLCWASANRDEKTFEKANEVMLDRKLNPHVAFGFSHHNCLGATHARLILRTLVTQLATRVCAVDVQAAAENIEELGEFNRKVGFNELHVKFKAL